MLRIGMFFIAFFFCANAKNIVVDFSVEYGIVGEVAKVRANLTTKANTYMFDTSVVVVGGIAKAVTDNLKERHISKGRIVNNLLVSDMYQMIKSYGRYRSTTIYHINHKKKRVTKEYRKWKRAKKIIDKKVTLSYYSKDDMITVLLNLPKHIKNKHKSKQYKFKVVGADRKNGRVDISIPTQVTLKEMKSLFGQNKKGDWYSRVVMHRKLYNSKKGELIVRIGQDDIVNKVVLKDLIFFGDIRIIRQ